jgi:serine-threonine kinase receptor-associated protein
MASGNEMYITRTRFHAERSPETAKVVPLTCHGHSRPVTHLSFSPIDDNGDCFIVSSCKDNNPMMRDGLTGDWIGTFIGHKGAVWNSRLSVDAALCATGSADFSAVVWDTYSGVALHKLDHHHIVRAVAFPPQINPQLLATGGQDKKLRIFDLSQASGSTDTGSPGVLKSTTAPSFDIGSGIHQGTIKSIVWGPDPNILITAADDKKIRWWDIRTQSTIGEYTVAGLIGSCELNTDALNGQSSSVLTVAAGKNVYFLDSDRPATIIKEFKSTYEISCAALCGSQRKFVTGQSGDTWVRIWDFDTETELGKSRRLRTHSCPDSYANRLQRLPRGITVRFGASNFLPMESFMQAAARMARSNCGSSQRARMVSGDSNNHHPTNFLIRFY